MTPVVNAVVGAAGRVVTAAVVTGAVVDVTAMIARHFEQRTRRPSGPAALTRSSGMAYLA